MVSEMNFKARLEALRKALGNWPCDALLIEHPIDIFYLTGLELSAGKLLISSKEACLIVDGRYIEKSFQQNLYPVFLLEENILKSLIVDFQIRELGFDEHQTTYHAFLSLTKIGKELAVDLVPIEQPVQQLRLIKDEEEITLLRQAAHLGYQGYEFLVSLLREGVTEKELAFELEFFWKKRGAQRLSFSPIIAFGPNSSMPHHLVSEKVLKQDMPVLIDIGVVLSHYHSDMTRVVFFGTPSSEMKKIYSIVEEAKTLALAACLPGTLVGTLDQIARDWIHSKGYGEYFTHSLGHGIGLDIHEPPILRQTGIYREMPLKPGMVITIEPGIYLPGQGGVRLEDTILITENGYENLTAK